jgi:creatinine amidohydrolase
VITPYCHLNQNSSIPAVAVALLPLAAVETHGPHLPLGTDGIIVEGIIDHAAKHDRMDTSVYRLPTLWIGTSDEHADRPGTLSREPEAVIAELVAIGGGLARHGIRRVVLLNGHGGNIAAAAIAALKLRTQFGMLAANAHWLDFGLPAGFMAPAPTEGDVHGGWIETSVLLHLSPTLVDLRQAGQAVARTPAPSLFPSGKIGWGWMTSDIAPEGFIGRPDLATADIGRALVEHAANRLNGLLADLSAAKWPVT